MPHITIEYSRNLKEPEKLLPLLGNLQDLLAEALPAKLTSFKSRAKSYDIFVLGNAQPDTCFVHCQVKVLPGRTKETLDAAAAKVLKSMRDTFQAANARLNLSVEIAELGPAYVKWDSGEEVGV